MNKKNNILLMPFIFIFSFIKHMLIGIKFVFFDAWANIFVNISSNKKFKKLAHGNSNKTSVAQNKNSNNVKIEQAPVLSFNERQKIALEKQELLAEMQKEINDRKISKEYYTYYGTLNGKKVKGTLSATNKITLNNFFGQF